MTLQELYNDIGRILKERPELSTTSIVNEVGGAIAGIELELPDGLEIIMCDNMPLSFWVEGEEASRWYERL